MPWVCAERAEGSRVPEDMIRFMRRVFWGGRLSAAQFVQQFGNLHYLLQAPWFNQELHSNTRHMHSCELCGCDMPVTTRCMVARVQACAQAVAFADPNGTPGSYTRAAAHGGRPDI